MTACMERRSYSAIIALLPRLLRSEHAEDYVGGSTMLKELGVKPVEKRKGLTLYDRFDLDAAIELRKRMEAGV